jgi:hypothetical protein
MWNRDYKTSEVVVGVKPGSVCAKRGPCARTFGDVGKPDELVESNDIVRKREFVVGLVTRATTG